MQAPDANAAFPIAEHRRVGFIKNLVTRPNIVVPAVKVGDGAIIAARSVVVKEVPPYAVVAGNPAQIIRRRFDDETVARLLSIAWWNWPIDKITRNLDAIRGSNLDALENAV